MSSLPPWIPWSDGVSLTSRYREAKAAISLLTCIEAKRAAMGTIGHGKQNNFRVKDVFARSMNLLTLLDKLEEFVLGQISPGTQHVASRVF